MARMSVPLSVLLSAALTLTCLTSPVGSFSRGPRHQPHRTRRRTDPPLIPVPQSSASVVCYGSKKPNVSDSLSTLVSTAVTLNPKRSVLFSVCMTAAGAALGPFLDSYHSDFGVLQYDQPFTKALWASAEHPALTTTVWVPELFGLAGFLIGWLYILLDQQQKQQQAVFNGKGGTEPAVTKPSPPKILVGIAYFTFQYWLSGVLFQAGSDRSTILQIESLLAAAGFLALDQSFAGFLISTATALGGPFIEAGLLSLSRTDNMFGYGYHYNDLGETGFFPIWILPVYFLGGSAVGNLARGVWNALGAHVPADTQKVDKEPPGCPVCQDTRQVPCPSCEGIGSYVAMGGRSVTCSSCRGRGFVICRACFDYYDEDPNDIQAIREVMSRMPD